ncbi:molybdopterin-dependent oxidoreductase [Burkholderia sp. LMG 21824]|uniref:molybdopterin-dependent oxidoreductase n=1 Tax=Burkholderia sp. LMG 21824 TaxID=3158172 RepID=UPI003C2F1FB5
MRKHPLNYQSLLKFTIFAISTITVILCHAKSLPLMLDVTGEIGKFTQKYPKNFHFSEDDLLKLRIYQITTSTPWSQQAIFKGVRLYDILKIVDARGSYVDIKAYDDYTVSDIPISEISKYQPILAFERNGERLRLSDYGPLFLVYPRDQFPLELKKSQYSTREIRQIKEISVK